MCMCVCMCVCVCVRGGEREIMEINNFYLARVLFSKSDDKDIILYHSKVWRQFLCVCVCVC